MQPIKLLSVYEYIYRINVLTYKYTWLYITNQHTEVKMADRTITISESSVLKALGIIIAVVIQAFAVYNALLNKFEDVRSENRTEVKLLTEKVQILEHQLSEIVQQDINMFRKVTELERKLSALENKK